MNLYGIGVDIVRVDRIRAAYAKYPTRFPARLLADGEMEAFRTAKDIVAFLSRRFAAKEAVAKSLGTGFAHGVGLRDIEITRNDWGRPGAELGSAAKQRLGLPEVAFALSLADETDYAVAYAMALLPEPRDAASG